MTYTVDIAAGWQQMLADKARTRLGIVEWDAERIGHSGEYGTVKRWVVRPKGAVGTMGWHPVPWDAIIVAADTREEALQYAARCRSESRK